MIRRKSFTGLVAVAGFVTALAIAAIQPAHASRYDGAIEACKGAISEKLEMDAGAYRADVRKVKSMGRSVKLWLDIRSNDKDAEMDHRAYCEGRPNSEELNLFELEQGRW